MMSQMSPVFVVACQRSGSTMLGAMLGAHPDIVCLPEAQFIGELLPNGASDPVDPVRLIDAIERHWRFRIWGFDLAGARPAAGELRPCFGAAIDWLVRRYAAHVGKPQARFWVEQQPGHIQRIWHLAAHFADCRFLHLVRDGRAVAASLMACDWGPNRILAAAKFWQERVAIGLAAELALGPERIRRVGFEALLHEPEAALGGIARFLGLRFDVATLRPTGLQLPGFAFFDHRLVGSDIERERATAWTGQLSSRAVEIFEAQTGDLLPLLGYELRFGTQPRPAEGLEKLRLVVEDQVLRWRNEWRFNQRRRRQLPALLSMPVQRAREELA
jgi:hypothetical protein